MAATAVVELLAFAQSGDHVVALISGGGSALLPAPVAGVSVADKAAVNQLLLASGADIGAMNMVRQRLSRLKGGGFAAIAAPARITAFVLSDVIGDDLRVIASGPTTAPIGTNQDAREMLQNLDIWDRVPNAVRGHLARAGDPAVTPDNAVNRLIGSNQMSINAMLTLDPAATLWHEPLTGDVVRAAEQVVGQFDRGITLAGGETTVTIRGTGLGGRNQELALRVAVLAEQAGWGGNWVFLSGGTDGRDGPTDAAGGLVDQGTLARMRGAGLDPLDVLARNDSYNGLLAAEDLLMTGATGTNVADLQVLIRP